LRKHLRNFIQQGLTRLRFLSDRTLGRELMQRMRDAQQRIDLGADTLQRRAKQLIADARAAFSKAAQSLKSMDPKREIALCRTKALELERRIASQPAHLLQNARQRFERAEGILRVLGPEATLRRGYSITTDADGKVIRSAKEVRAKTRIRTRVVDGDFDSQVLPR
jgi:exodeoxyribonuclease VII large subunit